MSSAKPRGPCVANMGCRTVVSIRRRPDHAAAATTLSPSPMSASTAVRLPWALAGPSAWQLARGTDQDGDPAGRPAGAPARAATGSPGTRPSRQLRGRSSVNSPLLIATPCPAGAPTCTGRRATHCEPINVAGTGGDLVRRVRLALDEGMTAWEMVAVAAAGLAAGGINAVVGSGTLVSFPVLLAVGLPPVTATISNSLGLIAGNLSGAVGYRRELRGQRPLLLRLIPASVLGALTGAFLLLHLPASTFEAIVPVLIAVAVLLVAVQPAVQRLVTRP